MTPSRHDREGDFQFHEGQAITPETDHTTHNLYAQPRNVDIDNEGLSDKILATLDVAFEEDKRIITGQTRTLAFDPDFRMLPLAVDPGLTQYRAVLKLLIQQEAQSEA